MIIDDYSTKLKAVYDSSITAEDPLKALPEALDNYKCLIRDFFSAHGGAPFIRDLYHKVHDPKYLNKYNDAIDVEKGFELFDSNFFPGMCGYICDTVCSDRGLPVRDRLSDMNTKVDLFIGEMFGGKQNPPLKFTLNESLRSLEHLIDFMGKMDEFKERCTRMQSMLYPKIADESAKLAAQLYSKSVSNFAYQYVSSVLKNVGCINKIITPEEPVIAQPVVKPKFELF